MADDSKIIILAIGGVGLWWLYENGYLAQWFGSSFAPALPTTTPVTTTPITTPVSTPVTTSSTSTTTSSSGTPPPPGITLVSPVTAVANNGLQASVLIGGQSAPMTIAVIPSQGQAYNTSGQGINNQLIALGVSVTHLIQLMQSAYSATSSSGGLTAANAATTPYSSSITAAQMSAIQSQLEQMISAGQVQQFNVGSVMAYMLGLGASCSAGQTQQVLGMTYQCFNGVLWVLQTSGVSGFFGARVSLGAIHGGLGWRVNQRMIG